MLKKAIKGLFFLAAALIFTGTVRMYKTEAANLILELAEPETNDSGRLEGEGEEAEPEEPGDELSEGEYKIVNRYFGDRFMLIEKNGKFGIRNYVGEVIIPPKYDGAEILGQGFLSMKRSGYSSVFNEKGKMLLPFKYDEVKVLKRGLIIAKKGGRWSVFSKEGRALSGQTYDEVREMVHPNKDPKKKTKFIQYVLLKNGDKTVIDGNGKVIVKNGYDEVLPFSADIYGYLVRKGRKYGYIDSKGNMLLQVKYPEIAKRYKFKKDTIYEIVKGEKRGVVNGGGKTILPLKYDEISVNMNHILAKKGKFRGAFDFGGKKILETAYDEIYPYRAGKAIYGLTKNGKTTLVKDLKGRKKIVSAPARQIEKYYQKTGLMIASVLKDGEVKKGLVNAKGEILLPFEYDRVSAFRKGVSETETAEGIGLVSVKGEVIVPSLYKSVEKISDNLVKVASERDGKVFYGLYSTGGMELLGTDYSEIGEFKDGFARLRIDGEPDAKYGIVDEDGKVRLEAEYTGIGSFKEGFAWIRTGPNGGRQYGFINEKYEIAIPLTFDDLQNFENGRAEAVKDGKWGYVNTKGTFTPKGDVQF